MYDRMIFIDSLWDWVPNRGYKIVIPRKYRYYTKMSNAFVFSNCFNQAKEILAKPQMSEKVLIDLLLHLDGKSAEEVKQIVSLLVEKVDKETGETMTKVVDGVLSSSVVLQTRVVEEVGKVEDVVEDDVKKVVDKVTRIVDVVTKSKLWCCK